MANEINFTDKLEITIYNFVAKQAIEYGTNIQTDDTVDALAKAMSTLMVAMLGAGKIYEALQAQAEDGVHIKNEDILSIVANLGNTNLQSALIGGGMDGLRATPPRTIKLGASIKFRVAPFVPTRLSPTFGTAVNRAAPFGGNLEANIFRADGNNNSEVGIGIGG